jgi:hypothetical protein
MSLLEKAKQSAKAADEQKKKEEANEIATKKFLQESLTKISKGVLDGLKEFHGAKTKRGTLKLIRKRVERGDTIATLRLTNRTDGGDDTDLLFIDAAVESGYRDYSDDCRNVPYIEAIVSIYVKNPPTDERYSYAPTCNGAVKGLGLSTYFAEFIRNWDQDSLPEKLGKVAEWIAPLFRE